MVEAGILAPIFAMMMMLNVYLGGVYEKKYLSVVRARYQTWNAASNSANNGGTAASNQDSPPSNPCSSASPPTSYSATSSMFMCKGSDDETWDYSPTYRFNPSNGPKTLHTEGMVVCNEQKNGINVFSYLGGEFSQMFKGLGSGSGASTGCK